MSHNATLLFLGTGSSAGIPVIGCDCAVCKSDNPKNKRLRPSALLTIGETRLLFDVGPDFRLQALRAAIKQIEGVLLTHTHYDHIAGIDELRSFYVLHKKEVPLLLSAISYEELKRRYYYLFDKRENKASSAQIAFQVLEGMRGQAEFCGLPLKYCSYLQAGMWVNGFRFGPFAYISDIHKYEESIFEDLAGVEILVMSALRSGNSKVHLTIDEAIAFSHRVGAKECYLMHISHDVDHDNCQKQLPKGVNLAFDGLKVSWTYDKN